MLRPLDDTRAAQDARDLASTAVVDFDFSVDWLTSNGLLVIPEESGLAFTGEQIDRLVHALKVNRVDAMRAVELETVDGTADVWQLEPTYPDLQQFSVELGGLNSLLFDPSHSCVVYCSDELDTLLVAGSLEFLQTYFGNLKQSVAEYWSFLEVHLEVLQPKLRTYLRHAAWVDDLRES
jgi:hypothetical protein